MELKKLLEGVPCELIQGNANQEITNIAYDSRAVERGGLFVCIEGFQTDGHKYIPSALGKGAAAIWRKIPERLWQWFPLIFMGIRHESCA